MAQYKVPQDVEADDKLIGPFSFRQFIYLLIVAALIALAWALARVFVPLALIPIPVALFLLALALPLRKDQPMETYIAALIRFYTTPNKRFWNPGQRESTITITAPKKVEEKLTKDLTEEEANRRLSFLADIVDSEGYSLKGEVLPVTPSDSPVRSDILAEANNATDIFETYESTQVSENLQSEATQYRKDLFTGVNTLINTPDAPETSPSPQPQTPVFSPDVFKNQPNPQTQNPAFLATPPVSQVPPVVNPRFVNLATEKDLSVATIAKQANRKPREIANMNDEVYISLH